MMRFAVLVLLLPGMARQDASVRTLVDSISDHFPGAAFVAISALVDLPDDRRVEIEKEAERLPAFYREVLLSELQAKRDLGPRFGSGLRIRLKGERRTAREHLEEARRLTGIRIDLDWIDRVAPQAFDVNFGEMWAMEAVTRVCQSARLSTHQGSWSDDVLNLNSMGSPPGGEPDPRPWFFYRNIAISFARIAWRKVIDFSGPPAWVARLTMEPHLGPDTRPVMWTDVRVLEARGVDGKDLRPPDVAEDTVFPGFESHGGWYPGPIEIALRMPGEPLTRLSRLRFRVTAWIPKEIRRYTVTEFVRGQTVTVGDDDFEIRVRPEEGVNLMSDYVSIRVKPKKVPHSRLANFPIRVEQELSRPGPKGPIGVFTGRGEETLLGTSTCTLRDGEWHDKGKPRRPLKVEVLIPVDLQERPIYAEFRDIPLK
jgi:hypothetical protein